MEKQLKYPKVLLVGRMNVGKSTLFNRLIEQKRSIVFEREGVTRDYIQELVTWNEVPFLLIDSGGLSFQKHKDEIGERVQEKVLDLLNQTDLLLFVCDGKNGLTDEDIRIANILRKLKKPIFLLINKADNEKALEENLPEFYRLGIDTVIPISGIHGTGIATLLNKIVQTIPKPTVEEEVKPHYNVVIIGRPNVGKSSLMNLLIQHERSIVSNIAGTTREAISEMTYQGVDLVQLTDTAGVRRSRKVEDELEELMVKSSLQAIRDANIVLVMIDASEGKIADQELKLLFYAYEQKKLLIVVFNKIDLLDEYTRLTLKQSIEEYDFILKKIPQISISCLTKKNVSKIFNEIGQLWQRCKQPFNAQEVNELVKTQLVNKHLYHNTIQLKVFKVLVQEPADIPTFVLKVNFPEWFGPAELGCIENILRNHYDLAGCPIQFHLRKER